MKTIGEKIKDRRESLGITQPVLSERTGITVRSISKYETGITTPRGCNLKKLAAALDVSEAYLITPNADNPEFGKEEAPYVDAVRDTYGQKAGTDMQMLLSQTVAMFAGGEIPQADKDSFFKAVEQAYVLTKRVASKKYNSHKNGK